MCHVSAVEVIPIICAFYSFTALWIGLIFSHRRVDRAAADTVTRRLGEQNLLEANESIGRIVFFHDLLSDEDSRHYCRHKL